MLDWKDLWIFLMWWWSSSTRSNTTRVCNCCNVSAAVDGQPRCCACFSCLTWNHRMQEKKMVPTLTSMHSAKGSVLSSRRPRDRSLSCSVCAGAFVYNRVILNKQIEMIKIFRNLFLIMLQSFTLLCCAIVKAKLSVCVCVCVCRGELCVYSTVLCTS